MSSYSGMARLLDDGSRMVLVPGVNRVGGLSGETEVLYASGSKLGYTVPWAIISETKVANSAACGPEVAALAAAGYAMIAAGQRYGCAVANIFAKWGSTAVTNGLVNGAADIHPTDLGHQDIANTLLQIL